jgi:hypothetical protein
MYIYISSIDGSCIDNVPYMNGFEHALRVFTTNTIRGTMSLQE